MLLNGENMKKVMTVMALGALLVVLLSFSQALPLSAGTDEKNTASQPVSSSNNYTGSRSCRKCHEKFYQLWAPSHHGLAMQSYTTTLAKSKLNSQTKEIRIGDFQYRPELGGDVGWIIERRANTQKKYRIEHVMGGKNVYYFLTTLDHGRLQTLPLAYDVNKQEWFDMAKSGVRHFPGQTDETIHWTDWQYTFNTACYGCHVSQISTSYNPKTDTYQTEWKEPGINCETCHGPAEEHVRVCEASPKGTVPKDLKMIRGGRDFTRDQNNAACASCHAKAIVLTTTFQPGDRFFDHFGLVTLEDPDYYPDGRDLGENYTYTSWSMSPCVKSEQLDCLYCHTSSGRYRFKSSEKANQACMPCHRGKVENSTEHTHHKADSPGNKCISCHMPTTEFARMRRTDHSMLPPAPAATMAFQSPNACNLCHKDKAPLWADQEVREWRKRDYQAAVLHRGGLIQAARAGNWRNLTEMLEYITSQNRDEVFATSLIGLVQASGNPRVAPVLMKASQDSSPLIRAAAVEALQLFPGKETTQILIAATGDSCRLVRIRAAATLAGYPELSLNDAEKGSVKAATREYLDSMLSRPDQWNSHYNLGNYYLVRGELEQAISSYKKALSMEPRAVLAMVNEAICYGRMGDTENAHEALKRAFKIDRGSAVVNFNLALMKAQTNDLQAAEEHLRTALKANPQMAEAAYNLCVILSKDRIDEAVDFCQKAVEIRPDVPKYAYTLAFYFKQKGDLSESSEVLERLLATYPFYVDAYLLLGEAYEKQGKRAEAVNAYYRGLSIDSMPQQYRVQMKLRLEAMRRDDR